MLYLNRVLTKHDAMNMKKKKTNTMKTSDKNWNAKKTGHMIIIVIEVAVLSHLRATSM